jgi:flagellar FliJ protein
VRLKVVLELAERKEQQAMDALQNKRRYLDQQQQQLQSLESYHQQYIEGMKRDMHGSLAVHTLQLSQRFMSQVGVAIEQQQSTVQIAQQEFDQVLIIWKTLHQKRKGMFDLIERYRNEENIEAQKQIEKQLESDFQASRFGR